MFYVENSKTRGGLSGGNEKRNNAITEEIIFTLVFLPIRPKEKEEKITDLKNVITKYGLQ